MNRRSPPPPFLDERRALACVHCGLCLSACPTYLETGNENDSPRGRIHLMRALQDGRLPLQAAAVRHLDLCLGCRACETACPSGVEYGELIESTRDFVERNHSRGFLDTVLRRWIIGQIFPHPQRLELALLPARAIRALRLAAVLPARLREWIEMLPDETFSGATLPDLSRTFASPVLGRVGLVTGCVMSVLFTRTHESTIRLLNAAGYDVVLPRGQGCCGALHAHGGNLEAARQAARQNLRAFAAEQVDTIVINAAGCGSTLKEYGSLLRGDPHFARQAADFAIRVRDLTEFLDESEGFLERVARPMARGSAPGRVTFHDACHLAHAQRITAAPRRLIRAVAGDLFVEMPESDVCCGSAGSYNLTEPDMARRLQQRKLDRIASLGPVTVITTNPGCLLQIRAGLRSARLTDTRVVHFADWLGSYLDAPPRK